MQEIDNYHVFSMAQEKALFDFLLVPYGELLTSLNSLKDLTKENIDTTINNWKGTYQTQIEQELVQHVAKLESYAEQTLQDTSLSDTAQNLLEANKAMLDVTTEYVRQKFIEIGVNEKAYGYDSEQVNQLMDNLLQTTADKLETFSIQSTINNLAQFLKIAAIQIGYAQYKWETQRDNKVRPSHVAMDGKWFDLDDESPEPAGYKPGIDWGCRCFMSSFR